MFCPILTAFRRLLLFLCHEMGFQEQNLSTNCTGHNGSTPRLLASRWLTLNHFVTGTAVACIQMACLELTERSAVAKLPSPLPVCNLGCINTMIQNLKCHAYRPQWQDVSAKLQESSIWWDMTPCGYQFEITCCPHFHLHRKRRPCVLRNVVFPPD